jgi:Mrp family chromosome partitioning ATPase
VVKALHVDKKKTVLITSPHDDAGNTFLVSVLGFNAAYFTNMSVLLIDLNMRRPFLHKAFGLSLPGGFNEIAMDLMDWRDAVKDTGLAELKIITAGEPSTELSFFLNRSFIKHMLQDISSEFELIIIDTSPVLISNINNVDPVYLSTLCDMVILIAQDKMTTKSMLVDAVDSIRDGGGDVNAIVYNHQF